MIFVAVEKERKTKMKLKFVPVKNQKFEWGRTINPFKCDCEECTFMNCPKNNYAVKMQRQGYSIEEFWDEYSEDILAINKPRRIQYNFQNEYRFQLTYNLLNEFMDALCFKFPTGTYWRLDNYAFQWNSDEDINDHFYDEITLVKFSRKGQEVCLGYVSVHDHKIHDCDLTDAQHRLAEKIRDAISWLKNKMFETYYERDVNKNIGWLAPSGRHYICGQTEHLTLAISLCGSEREAEDLGYIKIWSNDEENGYFLGNTRIVTAEQKNWLSLHGYILED